MKLRFWCAVVLAAVLARQANCAVIEVKEQWSGVLQDVALKAKAPGGGKGGAVTDQATFEGLWKAWGLAGAAPAVDFAKELVVVAVVDGPNRARLALQLDDKGNVTVLAMSTRMAGPGFGYAMGRVSREGVKAVDGVALAEVKAAPGTAPATGPAGGAGKEVTYDKYDGYFVVNTFEPDKQRSFVVARDKEVFDKVFHVAAVMNDRSHRLGAEVFEKQIVVAVVKRGRSAAEYTVESVTMKDGVVTVKYTTKEAVAGGGTASFASPLILSVPKEGVTKVEFVENGGVVGEVK